MDPDQINRGYRSADFHRWKNSDFVIGVEIHQSNNPDHYCDICTKLKGPYPKIFIWSGWHNKCKCFATPILESNEEFNRDELEELRAAYRGTEYVRRISDDTIKYLPEQFISWYMNNVQRMLREDSFPDFVTNNIDLIIDSYRHYKLIYKF